MGTFPNTEIEFPILSRCIRNAGPPQESSGLSPSPARMQGEAAGQGKMPAVCCLPLLALRLEAKPQEKGDGEVVHTQPGTVRLCPKARHKIFMSVVVTALLSG